MTRTERIGKQILAIRKLRDMTQAQLAEVAGINRFQMSYIENEQTIPTDEQLARIKAALDWSPELDAHLEVLTQ